MMLVLHKSTSEEKGGNLFTKWNILNFGPTIYRHEPIDQDDYTDDLFYIRSKTPLHMNMMICFVYWA